MSTVTFTQIADHLNQHRRSRKACIVSRQGIGDLVGLEVNVDTFPGQIVLDCRRADGEPWTAALVEAEFAEATHDHQTAALARLEHIVEAQRALNGAVDDARAAGCSWAEIGDVLGVSKQAAQQRFGD